jgi:hypothetical protein
MKKNRQSAAREPVKRGQRVRAEHSEMVVMRGLLPKAWRAVLVPCQVVVLLGKEVTHAENADAIQDCSQVRRFLDVCVERKTGARVQSSALYDLFAAWCNANGEVGWSQKRFSMAMKKHGFMTLRSDKVFWVDIKMTRTVTDFANRSARSPAGGSGRGERAVPSGRIVPPTGKEAERV